MPGWQNRAQATVGGRLAPVWGKTKPKPDQRRRKAMKLYSHSSQYVRSQHGVLTADFKSPPWQRLHWSSSGIETALAGIGDDSFLSVSRLSSLYKARRRRKTNHKKGHKGPQPARVRGRSESTCKRHGGTVVCHCRGNRVYTPLSFTGADCIGGEVVTTFRRGELLPTTQSNLFCRKPHHKPTSRRYRRSIHTDGLV